MTFAEKNSGRIDAADLRILVVEEKKQSFELIQQCIQQDPAGLNVKLDHASHPEQASVKDSPYDICFIHLSDVVVLLAAVVRLRQKNVATSIIALTESDQMDLSVRVVRAGATDCIAATKLSPELISRLIRYNLTLRKQEKDLSQIQADLNEAYSLNQQLLSSITSILIGISPSGKVQHWNAIAERTFGMTQDQLLNRDLSDSNIPWETQRVLDAVADCQQKKQPVRLDDVCFSRMNGQKGFLGFTIIPMKDSKQEVKGVLIFGADITRRKEDEEQLRQRTQELAEANAQLAKEKIQYQTLLENIGDGMIAVDQHGGIIMMNFQAEKMLGFKRGEAIGKNFESLIPMEDEKGNQIPECERPIYKTLKESKQTIQTAFYTKLDQNLFPAAITVSPVVVEGNVIGAIEIFRDITKQMEIDRLKSEFISTVSHELRTPLTGIREGVGQVLEGLFGPVNDDQREFLTIALKEIQRLTSIVNDLLDMSKIEAGKIELKKKWMDFNPLIRQLMTGYQSLMRSKQLNFKSIMPEGEVKVFADEEKITQVITNLISNAYKFTDEGGEITIAVSARDSEVEVSVQDTGQGIHPKDIHRVFERFVQVGRTDGPGIKGTGLGLPICKSLIELHKGRMWAESEPGKGSRFIFVLPVKDEVVLTDLSESDLRKTA